MGTEQLRNDQHAHGSAVRHSPMSSSSSRKDAVVVLCTQLHFETKLKLWSSWTCFHEECGKLGRSISSSDYTLVCRMIVSWKRNALPFQGVTTLREALRRPKSVQIIHRFGSIYTILLSVRSSESLKNALELYSCASRHTYITCIPVYFDKPKRTCRATYTTDSTAICYAHAGALNGLL